MNFFSVKLPTISALIFWLCIFEADTERPGDDSVMSLSDKVLSRKRRYLIFPRGSSIQLGKLVVHILEKIAFLYFYVVVLFHSWVYDSTITIPDYTIYVTTGVTCALAWGLPDRPVYPEDELMYRYEEGALPGLQYRNDVNVTEDEFPIRNMNTTLPSSSKTATRIDNDTLMNLIRLFYSNAVQPNASVGMPNYVDQHYYRVSFLPESSQMPVLSTTRKNIYYTSPSVTRTLSAIDLVDRNSNNPFKKYMADTYFKPWIGAVWQEQTTKK